jgi:pimeloyl-ACP methyl ester carboxylesterase
MSRQLEYPRGVRTRDEPRPGELTGVVSGDAELTGIASGDAELDAGPEGAGSGRMHRIRLHGEQIAYREAGRHSGGPVVLLVHGLASSSATWRDVLPVLGRRAHVLAPDLLGSGRSAKPAGADYSVGAHAARLRDLLRALGLSSASVVGHSFGGGVAMSFGYQFPERTDGLGLVASGGLGPELTMALRAATVPGAVLAAHAVASAAPWWLHRAAGRAATGLGLVGRADLAAVGKALGGLADPAARVAFLHTLRGAVDWSGQRLTALDRLELLAELPVLLVAGRRDGCIPYRHTLRAHDQLPGSRLELLDTGHFPHHEQPDAVARLIAEVLVPARPAAVAAVPSGVRLAPRAS